MKCLSVATVLAMALSGCAVPLGPYGQRPETLVALPRESAPAAIRPCPTAGDALVVKRFESRTLSPVGAFFASPKPTLDIMAQTYAADGDLELALFESTVDALQSAGCVTWKDYAAHPESRKGPPRTTDYVVLHAVVEELEIDTFGASQPQDAARARIAFVVHDVDGDVLRHFEVNAVVRIARAEGDVLHALGRKVAAQIVNALHRSP